MAHNKLQIRMRYILLFPHGEINNRFIQITQKTYLLTYATLAEQKVSNPDVLKYLPMNPLPSSQDNRCEQDTPLHSPTGSYVGFILIGKQL